jgi:hypothetical protein
MRFWPAQVLIAFDQLLNALHGGWADESISARAWRLRHRNPYKTYVTLIDALFFWQQSHCKDAYESEVQRRQLPPEYRP